MSEPLISISEGGAYVPLPQPKYMGYSTKIEDISKSGRNTRAKLYKERIALKQTVNVAWAAKEPAEKNLILRLTADNEFNVRFFDTSDGTFRYGTFYRGSEYEVIPLVRFVDGEFIAYDISMKLVEY